MKKEQKIKRIQRRAHRKVLTMTLGSSRAADELLRAAADKRIQRGLCLCGDDQKYYLTKEEADADNSPKMICGECDKPRLRVKIITDKQRLVLIDLLK